MMSEGGDVAEALCSVLLVSVRRIADGLGLSHGNAVIV